MNNSLNMINKVDSILGVKHNYVDFSKTYSWTKSYKGKNLSFIYKNSYSDLVEMYDPSGITRIKNDGYGIAFVDLDELSELFTS